MKPLQVYLSEAELKRLAHWAMRRGWTKSHAVRVAIRALTRDPNQDDVFLSSSGMIEGLPSDMSEKFDAYINETFVAEPRSRYRTRSRGANARPKR